MYNQHGEIEDVKRNYLMEIYDTGIYFLLFLDIPFY